MSVDQLHREGGGAKGEVPMLMDTLVARRQWCTMCGDEQLATFVTVCTIM